MGHRFIDLTGKIFGNLKVLRRGPDRTNTRGDIVVTWISECLLCGEEVIITASQLKRIKNHRGCYSPSHKVRFTDDDKRLHSIWTGMKTRCNNPNASHYYLYGGRGIKVCDEWQSFKAFRDWAIENGYSNKLSIDRIDNNKDYMPSNCRFVDNVTQSRNRRNIKLYKDPYDGEEMPLPALAEKHNINKGTLRGRINVQNLPIKEALEIPTTKGPKPRSATNAPI